MGASKTVIRLNTTRGALGLYGILLVLPTLVFAWLYWRELQKDYQSQLDAVPTSAQNGARRIVARMHDQLNMLLEAEEERPFYHYGDVFSPEDALGDDLALQNSPLIKARAPRGVLAWFSFDRLKGADASIDLFLDRDLRPEKRGELKDELLDTLDGFRRRKLDEDRLLQYPQLNGVSPEPLPLRALAIHLGHKEDIDCLKKCSPQVSGMSVSTGVSKFRLDFFLEEDGTPRAIASRRVFPTEKITGIPRDAECLLPLMDGFHLHQGLVIDAAWLFQELPFLTAGQVLGETGELVRPEVMRPLDRIDTVFADILPVRDLGFSTRAEEEEGYGKLEVSINTYDIDQRYFGHLKSFFGVGLMLVLSLATGFTLLYRSVNRELEQAHRTQNFVASVTHELRTPLSTIQLHGEMLMDGWVDEPTKRNEYYRRIVRETKRLSTLVERVLEKSQLKEKKPDPKPTPINSLVERLQPILCGAAEIQDLDFQLADDLPKAWLTSEAVTGILSNLVENARKYAPVEPGGEPILVATRSERGGERVVLEVADRGPGVPPEEKDKIFEAFYRVGSEATRTATGTGLGLHLVQLHAEATGAKASVHPREGGGSVFRVAFRSAG